MNRQDTLIIDDDGVEAFEAEAYRRAKDRAIIANEDVGEHVIEWSRDLESASMELSDAIGSCDRAAVLEIQGAADTLAAMRRLLSTH